MARFSIGTESFFDLDALPPGAVEQTALESRAGVDGTYVWKMGQRAELFRVRSMVDLEEFSDGMPKLRVYEKMAAKDPVIYRWAGQKNELQVVVLSVVRLELRPLVIAIGGLKEDSKALLRCEWELLPWIK